MLIKSIYLENFKGIQKLGNNIKLDLPVKKQEIILIKGENGFGKTTILENLHPFPYMLTRNTKDSIIYPAKKEIIFIKDNIEYKGIIIWEDEKNTKGFLYKNNELIKATEKGNISEYIYQIEQLFDTWKKFQTSVFLKQGVLDIINAKPSERLNIINNFMPNLDIFDNLKNDFKETEAEIKLKIKSLKEDIQNIEKFEEKYEKVKQKEKLYNKKSYEQAKNELKQLEEDFLKFNSLKNSLEHKLTLKKQLEEEIDFLKELEKERKKLKKEKEKLEHQLKTIDSNKLENTLEHLKQIKNFKYILEKYNFTFSKYKKLKQKKDVEFLQNLIEKINLNEHNKTLKERLQKEIEEILKLYPKWTKNLNEIIIKYQQLQNLLNETKLSLSDIVNFNKKEYEADIVKLEKNIEEKNKILQDNKLKINSLLSKIDKLNDKFEILKKYKIEINEINDFYQKYKNLKDYKQEIEKIQKLLDILNINNISFNEIKNLNKNNKYEKLILIEKQGIELKQKIVELNELIQEKITFKKVDWEEIEKRYSELEKQYITKDYIDLIQDSCPICSNKITPKKKKEIQEQIKNFDIKKYNELKELLLNKHKIEEENKKYKEQQKAKIELKKLEDKRNELKQQYINVKQLQKEYEFYNEIKNYLPEYYENIDNIEIYLKELKEKQKLFEKKQLLEAKYKNIKSIIDVDNLESNLEQLKNEIETIEKQKKELKINILKLENQINEQKDKLNKYKKLQKEYLIYKRFKELNIDINIDINKLLEEQKYYDKYKTLQKQLKDIKINKNLDKFNKEQLLNELNLLIETKSYNVEEMPNNLESKIQQTENKIQQIIELKEKLKNIKQQLSKELPNINIKKENLKILKEEIKNIEKEINKFDKNFENIYSETKEKLTVFIEEYNEFIIEKNDIEKLYNEYKEKEQKIIELQEKELIYNQLKNASDKIKKTIITNTFDNIINIANTILENEGTIKLKIFINQINSKKFEISVIDLITNKQINDISLLSGAEKMVVQKALSIALASNTNFKTLWMDEADGMLSEKNRNLYINMLRNIFNLLNIEEIFIISHNKEVEKEADTVIDLNKMIKYNY